MTSDIHEALVEATDQFVFGIDVESKLCYTNPAFAKTLNLHADEPVTIQSLIHPDNLIEFEKLLEAAFEKWRPGRFETSLVKPNKTQLFVEGSLAPSKEGDMIVGIFTDITDRKRAEEVLTRQASHLLLASESLEKRDQEITDALETAKKYQEEHKRAIELGRINENLEEEIQRRIEAEETLRSSSARKGSPAERYPSPRQKQHADHIKPAEPSDGGDPRHRRS